MKVEARRVERPLAAVRGTAEERGGSDLMVSISKHTSHTFGFWFLFVFFNCRVSLILQEIDAIFKTPLQTGDDVILPRVISLVKYLNYFKKSSFRVTEGRIASLVPRAKCTL